MSWLPQGLLQEALRMFCEQHAAEQTRVSLGAQLIPVCVLTHQRLARSNIPGR